jgi:hypothetical protein
MDCALLGAENDAEVLLCANWLHANTQHQGTHNRVQAIKVVVFAAEEVAPIGECRLVRFQLEAGATPILAISICIGIVVVGNIVHHHNSPVWNWTKPGVPNGRAAPANSIQPEAALGREYNLGIGRHIPGENLEGLGKYRIDVNEMGMNASVIACRMPSRDSRRLAMAKSRRAFSAF